MSCAVKVTRGNVVRGKVARGYVAARYCRRGSVARGSVLLRLMLTIEKQRTKERIVLIIIAQKNNATALKKV